MVTDPIGDLIIQIKNAGLAKKDLAVVPFSQMKFTIAKILEAEGYVKGVSKKGRKTKKFLEIAISYDDDGNSKVNNVKRISKPSRRIYLSAKEIKPVRSGTGLLIVSTPGGVMAGSEARKKNIGGEILFEIW